MRCDDILAALKDFQSDNGYAATTVEVLFHPLDSAAEVDQLLCGEPSPVPAGGGPRDRLFAVDWRSARGWIVRQSAAIPRPRQEDDPATGAVLEAELVAGMATLQIRRLPGSWIATMIFEGKGTDCLSDDLVLATVRDNAARYRRYWALPADGAVTLLACRLTGLEEIK
jgi:hypothetical protein